MIRFDLTVRGDQAVRNELRAAAASMPRRVANATYDWGQSRVVSQLTVKGYPPKRPGQRYKRTYRLQGGWQAKPTGNGVMISNRQPYAGYVVGDAKGQRQAWMHKGRWYVARTIIDGERPRLRAGISDEVSRAFPSARRVW